MGRQSILRPWAFLALAAAVYFVFAVFPIAQSFLYSLYDWDLISPEKQQFVGLENYDRILAGSEAAVFWLSLWHNIILLVLSLVIQLPIAFVLALILTAGIYWKGLFRTLYFAPMMMSTVAVGLLWKNIYGYDYGLLNELLRAVGVGKLAYPWLAGDATVALLAIVGTVSWRFIGFHTVILMAGLESIPRELYEAARVDGATGWQAVQYITLPLMRTPLVICATLSIIGALKYFDIVWVMTRGDAPYPHATDLTATYLYKVAFDTYRGGLGSAIAVALFVITMGVSILFLRRFGKKR